MGCTSWGNATFKEQTCFLKCVLHWEPSTGCPLILHCLFSKNPCNLSMAPADNEWHGAWIAQWKPMKLATTGYVSLWRWHHCLIEVGKYKYRSPNKSPWVLPILAMWTGTSVLFLEKLSTPLTARGTLEGRLGHQDWYCWLWDPDIPSLLNYAAGTPHLFPGFLALRC